MQVLKRLSWFMVFSFVLIREFPKDSESSAGTSTCVGAPTRNLNFLFAHELAENFRALGGRIIIIVTIRIHPTAVISNNLPISLTNTLLSVVKR